MTGLNDKLWYRQPAEKWEEALPVGNGRLGGMVFGGADCEKVQLNEDSIWFGGPINRINPDARKNLEKVRSLIFSGNISQAELLLEYAFSGIPSGMRPYQPLGYLYLDMHHGNGNITAYKRELRLSDSIHHIEYMYEQIRYSRDTFVSYPAGILVMRITADRPACISFSCRLERKGFLDKAECGEDGTVFILGSQGQGGVNFCGCAGVQTDSGSVTVVGEDIIVEWADAATVYFSCETSYYNGEDYIGKALARIKAGRKKGYAELRNEHIKDYLGLYSRIRLRLAEDDKTALPTDQRLAKVQAGETDNGLIELYFNYGRYLLISSSRPGSLPANLQGIWNDRMEPPWDSKFTININTEMNYWPAECCGLPECHIPLFFLLTRMQDSGHRTAREMYGCRGFVAHHNTDLWGDCAPQDRYVPATYWVMGGAWLCTHIWMHYEYTLDKEWLKTMYPILREAVLFFEDFLVEKNGLLQICPSCSPENTYIMDNGAAGHVTAGSTMDNSILKELIQGFLKASEVLGVKDEVTDAAEKIPELLAPLKVGRYGQIMEWRQDYQEMEPGHRHISQLYALFPGHDISPGKTPVLAQAAEKTLRRRLEYGSGHTGWSCAWIVALFAKLCRGNDALQYLMNLLRKSTYPNLMDTHPLEPSGSAFQIDGNLGAAAAVVHMLAWKEGKEIRLLPALPDEWKNGEIEGMHMPGGIILSLKWENACPVEVELQAKNSSEVMLIFGEKIRKLNLKSGERKKIEYR